MQRYEYRVVPAPNHAERSSRTRSRTQGFTQRLEMLMNELGAEGWEYLRADTMPVEMQEARNRTQSELKNVLVFRRVLEAPDPGVAAEEAQVPRLQSLS